MRGLPSPPSGSPKPLEQSGARGRHGARCGWSVWGIACREAVQVVSEVEPPERLRGLADAELVGLTAGFDAAAFEVLYERHHVLAFSLAVRIVGSRDRAQEVVQEAFLNLWRDAPRFDPRRGAVRTWLMRMVQDRAIDSVRRMSTSERAQAAEAILMGSPSTSDASAQVHADDEARTVRVALDALPPEQRQVIELAYFEGWTQREIAEMLEVPVGTIKGRARLGLLKLRDALVDQLQAPP